MSDERDAASGRWQGRNSAKDSLRTDVWTVLEASGVAIGPAVSRIPNFVGAEKAAARLAALSFWKRAQVVQANPDLPQTPVRLAALQDGKLLYMPVPAFVRDLPFVELDPAALSAKGVPFALAATPEGALAHGKQVGFLDMRPFDVCVVGCVAVTRKGGRMGEGAGLADLELGIFHETGLMKPEVPIVTTVHALQVVTDDSVVMGSHDWALDWIVTPSEVIETHTPYPQPAGVAWDDVRPDQFRDIPFLVRLKNQLA